MAIPENVKNNWIEIQKKFDYPVNAIGVKINPTDSKTLNVWFGIPSPIPQTSV